MNLASFLASFISLINFFHSLVSAKVFIVIKISMEFIKLSERWYSIPETREIDGKARLKEISSLQRKTTSLKIDQEIWKKAKKKCIDRDLHVSEYIESLIKKDLKIISIIFFLLILGLVFGAAFSEKVAAEIDLMGLTMDIRESGIDVSSGNISVEIYDAASAGNLIYKSRNNFIDDLNYGCKYE